MIEAEIAKRSASGQSVVGLHVGDAHNSLPTELLTPVHDEDERYGTLLNRYGDARGDIPLREALLKKIRDHNQIPASGLEDIQVTCGATGGLHAGFSRLLDPGSEVLTLAPYWSILRVVADHSRVYLVEVPFFDRMLEPGFDTSETLEKYRSDKTKAIYLNTPSNPTGMILGRKILESIAEFARKYDLWVFSDEAYENFIFSDEPHISFASLDGMYDRTVTVHSFSKCFGASGMRVGYVTAPSPVIAELHRGVVGSVYHAGRYAMRMAWRGMLQFDSVVNEFYQDYRATWAWVRDNLALDKLPATAGFYFFVRLPVALMDPDPKKKILTMLDHGFVLAPGEYFGKQYSDWARLCFTVEKPEEIQMAVSRLNSIADAK